jgi:hypothetical protein
MRPSTIVRRLLPCAVIAVAACSDANAPTTIASPAAVLADLLAVDSVFDSDAYRALQGLTGFIPIPAPPAIDRLVTGLRAALPSADRRLPRRDASLLAGVLGTSSRPPVLPDTLLGLTFEWQPDSVRYVASGRGGGPPNGVRFILYEADPLTSLPDTSLEVGALDILDLAPAAGAQLRFLVRGVSSTPTFLDYTLTYLSGPGATRVGATGFVSNGVTGSRERRFTFSAALSATATAAGAEDSVDFSYDLNVPDVAVALRVARSADTLQDSTLTATDYRLTRRSETIGLLGVVTQTNLGSREDGQFAVGVNGHLYAVLTIINGNGVITDRSSNVVPIDLTDQRHEDDVMAIMLLGVLHASAILLGVLAIPAFLLGFTVGLP